MGKDKKITDEEFESCAHHGQKDDIHSSCRESHHYDEKECHCHEHGHEHSHGENEEENSLPKIIGSAVLFLFGLLIEHLPLFSLEGQICNGNQKIFTIVSAVKIGLFCISYLLVGLEVLKEAFLGIGKGEIFGEEFLMSIATIGAIVLGQYPEAVAVMLLFQIGEFLEDFAVGNSKKSIRSLMDIRPDRANIKKDGKVLSVLSEDVKKGDIIVVKPGERIPLDGKIISGSSMVDTSALTGESIPKTLEAGDDALSGFVNESSVLEIEVTKEFSESTVSRVLEMVEKAQEKKSRAQKFVKRFSKVYTPIVCIIAVAIAVIPSVICGGSAEVWKKWIYRALEILVVSCPCALVISVPLSFFSGIGLASKKGILVKGANYVESLAKAGAVVFDKTGTLTKGVFEVTAVHPAKQSGFEKDELLAFASHAEFFSNHPISKSLKAAHSCERCGKIPLENMEEISGHGIKVILDGKKVFAGNEKLMIREGVQDFEKCSENDSGTIVHVAVEGKYAGHIVINDVIKEDSPLAMEKLRKEGINERVMLTGDSESAAEEVGKKIGIDRVYFNLLPEDKVSKIEEVLERQRTKKKTVCFVGDGINDAPVLSRSDVGIAMGGAGSDAAIEAADVVIMDDKPSKVALAIETAKKTMVNVWENVLFALVVKTGIMILCATGLANMWLAVFGDVGVTMLAVLNSMRLLYCDKDIRKSKKIEKK